MNEITQRIYDRIVRDLQTLSCDFIVVTPEGHMDQKGSLQLQTEEVAPKIVTKTVEIPAPIPSFFPSMLADAREILAFVVNGSSNQEFVRNKAAHWMQRYQDHTAGPRAEPRAKLAVPGTTPKLKSRPKRRGPNKDDRIDWAKTGHDLELIEAMEVGDTLTYPFNGVNVERLGSRLSIAAYAAHGRGAVKTKRDHEKQHYTLTRVK